MLGRRGAKGINVGFGFNLIGLLLVVAILGISAVVAVSSLGGTTSGKQSDGGAATTVGTSTEEIGGIANQSAVTACQADASQVQTAIQEYDRAAWRRSCSCHSPTTDDRTFSLSRFVPLKSRLYDFDRLGHRDDRGTYGVRPSCLWHFRCVRQGGLIGTRITLGPCHRTLPSKR